MESTILPVPRKRALKNLLARMIGELYYPEYQARTYAEADIPTREVVDAYMPQVIKLFKPKRK